MTSRFNIDKDFYIELKEYYFILHQKSTEKKWIKKYLHQCFRVYIEIKTLNAEEPVKGLETVKEIKDELEDFLLVFTKHKANFFIKDGKVHNNNQQQNNNEF